MNRIALSPRRSPTQRRRPQTRRLELERLEARNLLSFTNVLVNNPAEDTTIHDTQSETAIVLGAKSNVVVAYNDTGSFSYPTPLNPTGTGYSLSTNGGGSFTDEGSLPGNPPYWGGFDQVLARSGKTGTIFLSDNSLNTNTPAPGGGFLGERINIFRSLDNGQTFSPPLNGTPGFVAGVDLADKDWIAVDNYPGPGYGNVYLAWTDYDTTGTHALATYLTRSTDDGQTWGPTGGVALATTTNNGDDYAHGVYLTVGPDHAVYAFYWDYLNGNNGEVEIMRKSTDYGQTFGPEVIVASLRTKGGNGALGLTYSSTNRSSFQTNAYPQAAVNPVSGDIYVVYDDEPKGSTHDKADIFFTMSTDGGNTWNSPPRVNDDLTTTDQWEPAIALTPDGKHLFITWYDRRNDPSNDSLIDRYGVIGTISGHTVSFPPNFRITDVSFPPAFAQDPYAGSTYMGDYDQAVADNNYFYTTWGDNRLGDAFFANQPDVRFAKIPVTGLDPATALLSPSSSSEAPAGSTGTATVPVPGAAQAGLARSGNLLPGDFLAAAAGVAPPLPGQAAPPAPAAPTPATEAAPPLAPQAVDCLFAPAGKPDGPWHLAATPAGRHGTGDGWGDALAQAPWGHDPLATTPPAA
jgi:hypothetical protein